MSITDWPLEDRPREKLLEKGAEMLTDAELIAIFLVSGRRGKTALDIAKNLLVRFGNLKTLLRAKAQIMLKEQGIGRAKYAMLLAALEIGKRYQCDYVAPKELMNDSKRTSTFLIGRLRDRDNEVFACLFMDNHLRLIRFEELSLGTINEATVYPREVVKRALFYNAAKVILAHNHPSGCPLPSRADQLVTEQIKAALALIDIDVVDHIIVGNPDYFSFADVGLL